MEFLSTYKYAIFFQCPLEPEEQNFYKKRRNMYWKQNVIIWYYWIF